MGRVIAVLLWTVQLEHGELHLEHGGLHLQTSHWHIHERLQFCEMFGHHIRKKQPKFSYPRVWNGKFAKIGFSSYPKDTFSYPWKLFSYLYTTISYLVNFFFVIYCAFISYQAPAFRILIMVFHTKWPRNSSFEYEMKAKGMKQVHNGVKNMTNVMKIWHANNSLLNQVPINYIISLYLGFFRTLSMVAHFFCICFIVYSRFVLFSCLSVY